MKRNRNRNKYPRRAPDSSAMVTLTFLSYLFSGINFIVAGFYSSGEYSTLLFLAAVPLFITAMTRWFDNRIGMRTVLYAIMTYIANLCLGIVLVVIVSWWWLLILIGESFLCFLVTRLVKKRWG